VWLASGQSNMAMTVNRARDFEKEKAAADHPQIRTFTVARSPKREPQADCKGQWVVCSPETVGTFSAAAYFFGRLIQREVGVPVGLINSSYGGTDVCAWTSEEAMKREPAVEPVLAKWARDQANWDPARAKAAHEKQLEKWQADAARAKAEGKPAPRKPAEPVEPRLSQNHPANLYNGMIAPVLPYAIKGALWYQGEANSGNAEAGQRYKVQLPLLIADWRARWGQGDFPFAWVQLPNYNRNGEGWMLVREAMLESLKVPHTGMAVTTDVGDPGDIHPTNKQAVGERLAWWALAAVYGRANVPASSPLPGKHEVAGKEVVVTFAHTGGGLTARGGGEVRGFVIAGADKKWLPAKARIEGDRVIVWHPDVAEPAAVRYNWAANPDGNLFNATGQLPATPFRTDRW
jgi:hypothetical protein